MHQPRLVVFGYGEPGLAALETLARLGVTPAAVVVPGNRQGRDVDVVVADAARRGHQILTQPSRPALPAFLDDLRRIELDLMLVWSYSMILPQALIDLPRLGAVNVHGGLLPEYRGGHVMQWALINGEPETGVTLHYMDAGVDTGPVIAQQRFPIEATDDAASVQKKLIATGGALLTAWWPAIANGTAPRVTQDESRACYHRMRSADDGRVDWTRTSSSIANLVRALVAPWPGAFTMAGGSRIVLRQVAVRDDGELHAQPGTVTRSGDDGVYVATGSGEIALLATEVDGSAADSAALTRAGVRAGRTLG